jgi:Zn finger protein HypA/HybF involved in hydrogenase expression
MKQCPKCNTEHNKPGTFCSRTCANSRDFSEASKTKKSVALKGKPARRVDVDTWKKNISEAHLKRFAERTFEECGWDSKRARVIKEQDYKCIKCGLAEWLDSPLIFEIDHKDGDNTNDTRENLEAMCPNCHSTTDTWRGRNKVKA